MDQGEQYMNKSPIFFQSLYGNVDEPNSFLMLWTLQDRQAYSFPLDSSHYIEDAVETADQLAMDKDVFFGLGLQGSDPRPGRGTADGVIAIPGLWIDVDVYGQNHVETNLPKSIDEAMDFVNSMPLSPTIVVNSGGGLHVYWLFKEIWVFSDENERQNAQCLSSRFQDTFIHNANKLGWNLDNTSDLARVLRVPGTFNRKKGQCLDVQILSIDEKNRYNQEDFEPYLIAPVANMPSTPVQPESAPVQQQSSDCIMEGKRNSTLTSRAGIMRRAGFDEKAIFVALMEENRKRCNPPLPEEEVKNISKSINKYKSKEKNILNTTESKKDYILQLIEDFVPFFSQDGNPYISIPVNDHTENYKVYSDYTINIITHRYYSKHKDVPSDKAIKEILSLLAAKSKYEGLRHEVFIRVAQVDDVIYVDLGNVKGEVIQISPDGWNFIKDVPVKFLRPPGMGELPCPVEGGNLRQLSDHINVRNDEDLYLILGWIVECYRPGFPKPILNIRGEQGSAKSTTTKILKALIDPSFPPLRSFPSREDDLIIAASNQWLLSFDNLSHINADQSDALCCLATDGGFSKRKLYSDSDEICFHLRRPIILNGIVDTAHQPDLIDRTIFIDLPSIPNGDRKTESVVWSLFDKDKAIILGAIFDALSVALKNYRQVKINESPRMIDFATFATAAESAWNAEPGSFIKSYQNNRSNAVMKNLEEDPVASGIIRLMDTHQIWAGSAQNIIDAIECMVTDSIRRSRAFPDSP